MTAPTLEAGASLDVVAFHLGITQNWPSGESHSVHLLENGDIGVTLLRGQQGGTAQRIPESAEGHVVVVLGVDEDHDEVHFTCRGTSIDTAEILTQAINSLTACRDALGVAPR